MCYAKNIGFKIEFLTKFLNDSAWLCVEKLKKHVSYTNKPKKYPKIPNTSQNIREQIAFIGAFKGPCTLP